MMPLPRGVAVVALAIASRGKAVQVDPVLKALVFQPVESTSPYKVLGVSDMSTLDPYSAAGAPPRARHYAARFAPPTPAAVLQADPRVESDITVRAGSFDGADGAGGGGIGGGGGGGLMAWLWGTNGGERSKFPDTARRCRLNTSG